jgi:outer membrane protein OmpA-like peptidoglycan-associated protein
MPTLMSTIRHTLRPALALLLSAAACAALAQVQPLLSQTSIDALVAALNGGPPTRSFQRTQLPDAGSNLCAGQGGATAVAGRGVAPAGGGNGRNLEVVPYAGDTTPGVNLSVQFATASDRLTAADQALLNTVAKALLTPDLAQDRFAVAGHTDSTGDARINLELSCARALAVRRHLVAQGVAVQRLSAYGFGSTRLLAAGEPAAGVNRRVEVRKAPE